MKIGMIGLGKMGYNLALNLRDHGHEVVAYNRSEEAIKRIEAEGVVGARSVAELVAKLPARRVIWIMVPSGAAVEEVLEELSDKVDEHDILIDGGNSNYKDTLRRFELLSRKNIDFVDVGTSGGIEGARNGACTMIGSSDAVFQHIEPILRSISVEGGCLHTGENGSGHYVKMIHNGIEYGMMQAIGEGFDLLNAGPYDLDYKQVAGVWNRGSVIRGWLMELTESLFQKSPTLDNIKGVIDSSGEALWTLQEALDLKVSTPAIAMSLFTRFASQSDDSFSNKVVAGLRNEFGGHPVTKSQKGDD
ncbi:MAG: decarboxylating 6-phosphogluconate dehydrogenase [Clostridia bacterium]|nr:decarboxylating 6-phosphogluconate dehydrogenase [Clostridia bacterium]